MSFSTNDDLTNRELSTSELDAISAAGFWKLPPFGPGLGPIVLPTIGVTGHGQGGDTGRPHPGVPPYQAF